MNQERDIATRLEEKNKYFMKEALLEAQKAFEKGEVPVGAVIVRDGIIISRGHNLKETINQSFAHAEMLAISEACKVVGDWRLNDCEMYVTLEPCPMCLGALIQSRIMKLYYGAKDLKSGAVDSIINMLKFPWNHKFDVEEGILAYECEKILKDFFSELRKN